MHGCDLTVPDSFFPPHSLSSNKRLALLLYNEPLYGEPTCRSPKSQGACSTKYKIPKEIFDRSVTGESGTLFIWRKRKRECKNISARKLMKI